MDVGGLAEIRCGEGMVIVESECGSCHGTGTLFAREVPESESIGRDSVESMGQQQRVRSLLLDKRRLREFDRETTRELGRELKEIERGGPVRSDGVVGGERLLLPKWQNDEGMGGILHGP